MLDQKREGEVANLMTNLLLANCTSTPELVPQAVLAHYFGVACEKLEFIPDEPSARRIFHSVSGKLSERRRVADRLNEFILLSTEELLKAQREARRPRPHV